MTKAEKARAAKIAVGCYMASYTTLKTGKQAVMVGTKSEVKQRLRSHGGLKNRVRVQLFTADGWKLVLDNDKEKPVNSLFSEQELWDVNRKNMSFDHLEDLFGGTLPLPGDSEKADKPLADITEVSARTIAEPAGGEQGLDVGGCIIQSSPRPELIRDLRIGLDVVESAFRKMLELPDGFGDIFHSLSNCLCACCLDRGVNIYIGNRKHGYKAWLWCEDKTMASYYKPCCTKEDTAKGMFGMIIRSYLAQRLADRLARGDWHEGELPPDTESLVIDDYGLTYFGSCGDFITEELA